MILCGHWDFVHFVLNCGHDEFDIGPDTYHYVTQLIAPSEDSDQTAQMRSLIRVFAWHSVGTNRLQDSEEAYPSLRWTKM